MITNAMSNPSVNETVEQAGKKVDPMVVNSFLLACLINKRDVTVSNCRKQFNRKVFNLAKPEDEIWIITQDGEHT